jgi:hypothetical protein
MDLELVPADTTPEAAQVQFEVFRRMAPSRRLLLALKMSDTLQGIAAAGVHSRHPAFSEEQVRLAVVRLTLGEELFQQAYQGGKRPMLDPNQQDFLMRIAQCLESAGISFMVAGSVGSSYHGQPRATNDIDLVIDPTAAQLDHFLTLLGDQYYVSPEAAREALQRRSMFNLIDLDQGMKVDLIIRKDRPFSVAELQRRRPATVSGQTIPIASPEDVILTKLEWNRLTPSDRQVRDAFNVAVVQGARLDRGYLRQWAPELGVAGQLEGLLQKADETQPKP